MSKLISHPAFLSALLALSLSSCCAVTSVNIPDSPAGGPLLGVGVELDPHFFAQNLTRNDGATEADWYDVVVPRVQKMDVQRFRVMLQPHWWEPYKGQFTYDSPEVRSVCAVLDLAEQCGIDVTLVLWGCPISAGSVDPAIGYIGRHYLAIPEGGGWVTKCNDHEEFAANFVAFYEWLVKEKGYTCIRELTPYNEPDGDVSPLEEYVLTARALDAELQRKGLRDNVNLNLSDNTDVRRYFLKGCARELADEADLFNSHTYIFGYDDANCKALNWEKRNVRAAAKAGKRHFVGEFGSDQCVGATRQKDINFYERGVLIVRNALNFLNAGAAGFSYWSLIDQYYSRDESYIQMQQLGLWRYKECAYEPGDLAEGIVGDYAVRPQYYAYSLLTRFVRKGDEVYPLDMKDRFIAGSAVKGGDGAWTYIIANASQEPASYRIEARGAEGDVYVYSRQTLPEGDAMIEPSSNVKASDGNFELEVPAESVVLVKMTDLQ